MTKLIYYEFKEAELISSLIELEKDILRAFWLFVV